MKTREIEEFAEPQMQQLLQILAEYKLLYAKNPSKFLKKRISEIENAIQPIGKSVSPIRYHDF